MQLMNLPEQRRQLSPLTVRLCFIDNLVVPLEKRLKLMEMLASLPHTVPPMAGLADAWYP